MEPQLLFGNFSDKDGHNTSVSEDDDGRNFRLQTTAAAPSFSTRSASAAGGGSATSLVAEAEKDVTMKPGPAIKAVKVRRHSKQLPRLLLQASHSTAGTSSTTVIPWRDSSSSSHDNDESKEKQPRSSSTSSRQQSHPRAATMSSSTTSPGLCLSLPDDLICKVTCFLDVGSLMQIQRCNKHLKQLASRNEAGWHNLCYQLWSDKVHVLPKLLSPTPIPQPPNDEATLDIHSRMTHQHHYRHAYFKSILDANERHHVTTEELCYDPVTHKGTVWSFRFKECAGEDWTASDPWYSGLPCRKMVFLKDGSVRQYIPGTSTDSANIKTQTSAGDADALRSSNYTTTNSNSNSETSDSESSLPELINPNFGRLVIETPQQSANNNEANELHNDSNQQLLHQQRHNGRLIHPPMSMTWRFVSNAMDLPERPHGSYLRFSVGGREVPTYSVRRSPLGNWGFVMESCWGVYASFELPPKRSFRQLNRNQQENQQQRRRLRRTETGARWVDVIENGEEIISVDQDRSALMDDSALEITNEVQWREAFLYNVGARVLPEGDGSAEEFDRTFRGVA